MIACGSFILSILVSCVPYLVGMNNHRRLSLENLNYVVVDLKKRKEKKKEETKNTSSTAWRDASLEHGYSQKRVYTHKIKYSKYVDSER